MVDALKEAARREPPASTQTARAAMGLRDLIVEGALTSEERFTEVQLAERLGMSRTPIRAAIQHLREEGLIEPAPQGGYRARGFSPEEIAEAIELRGLVEGFAARLLAERGAKPEDLEAVSAIADRIDPLLNARSFGSDEILEYGALNAAFHEALVEATGSSLLIQEARRANARPFAWASALVNLHEDPEASRRHLILAQDQHRVVVEAIRAREGARAEAVMREHARLSQRNLKKALEARSSFPGLRGVSLIRQTD